MMQSRVPCESWLDTLVRYEELTPEESVRVKEHVAGCDGCRVFLESARALDRDLSSAFADVVWNRPASSPVIPQRAPTLLPEVLDFTGACSCVGALLAVGSWAGSHWEWQGGMAGVLGVAGVVFASAAAWVSRRTFAELR